MPPRFVIVGTGIAGLAAAETIRERVPDADIAMIGEERHAFYSRPGLAYLLRGDIPEKQLFIRSPDDIRKLHLERIDARVARLDCLAHRVVLEDGETIRYDRVLLATGAQAVPAPFPGGDIPGVMKLDSLDDARAILKAARRARSAVVVGGGITALELAEGLNARRVRVQYLLRGDRYWSDVLDETESAVVEKRLEHEGIALRKKTQVAQARAYRRRLDSVETDGGERIDCDILAVAIGVRPRVELAREAGLIVDRGIVVNEYLETSVPNVYAAGDAAQAFDPLTGASSLDVLWSTALAQGKAAGANMAGARQPYVKGVPFNVTQLGGLRVTIVGAIGKGGAQDLVAIARGDSETWRHAPEAWMLSERHDVNRVRLLFGDRVIVGALVMGDQTWSRPLHQLIAGHADISPVRDKLARGGARALQALGDFYGHWLQQRPAAR